MDEQMIARIEQITGIRDIGEPAERGNWATWDQRGSRGIMNAAVAALKMAGIPAFFSAADRRWGVKV